MYNSKKFITMDLETRTINEVMTSYCVSIYDGTNFKSFYLSDYSGLNSESAMLKDSIQYLMKRKYNNHKIYLHNFSRFDAIFLMKTLTDLSDKVSPVIRDGQFIDLKFKYAGKYNLFFRDSLLLLPSTLKKLAESFNVDNKGYFPYCFVNNKDISLNYIGPIPDIKYFYNLTVEEYNNYSLNKEYLNSWDLRIETIKYCERDCLVLYQILNKYSDYVYNKFRIDLLKYPTLSSLAFAIFRSNYYKDEYKIPLIHGEMYNFIKKSYTGGSVDVYKPQPTSENTKVIGYDVNSLYPYAMKNYPMPCGEPIYFEGDILNPNIIKLSHIGEDKPFGIFEVDIECPLDIKIPLLQTRVKTKKGTRTIAPVGTWTGHYFSDELYNASKFGYKFKVKRGYLFEKRDIFSSYVDSLYKIKESSKYGEPNYIISKLLLNSLYGRLGMNPVTEQHLIVSNDNPTDFYSNMIITNVIDLKNGKELISYFKQHTDDNLEENSDIKNISVVTSSIVTASARIQMSLYKTIKGLIIYYSDTDSLYVNMELDNKYIGPELGKLKLEHIFNDAVFLAPKVYGGITDNYEYIRIKGLKNPIKFEELKTLLSKESKLEIKQEKWYADISNAKFYIKDEIYTLMVTDNKRKLIFNEDNKFIDTEPLKLVNGQILD